MNKSFLVGLLSVVVVVLIALLIVFGGFFVFGIAWGFILFMSILITLGIVDNYEDICKLGDKIRRKWDNQ